MSIESIRLSNTATCISFRVYSPSYEITAFRPTPPLATHTVMWRIFCKRRNLQPLASSFHTPFSLYPSSSSSSSLISRPSSVSPQNNTSRVARFGSCPGYRLLVSGRVRMLHISTPLGLSHINKDDACWNTCLNSYSSVAEAASSFEVEENVVVMDEVQQQILKEIRSGDGCVNQEKKAMRGVNLSNRSEDSFNQEVYREEKLGKTWNAQKGGGLLGFRFEEGKYDKCREQKGMRYHEELRRRQVKIETEAWEEAAEEYRALLKNMCAYKLVPNLPYMKLLFLGWFNPLREAIDQDREWHQEGKKKTSYGPYFQLLPADMIAVITMHKVMALMMSKYDYGSVKVVPAACDIGDAIEQEARLHKFMEKTDKRKQNMNIETLGSKSEVELKEQDKLRKRVKDLMKKQKLQAVNKAMKEQDDSEPWDQDIKAKIGSRLIELLIQTAYIQHSSDANDPPEIRPAFVHTTSHTLEGNKKNAKRCGIIKCDPVIVKGLEKTAKHMLIPYMPMLVPPIKWSRYDKGGYLFLPSFAMRTHGSRQQREVLKMTPNKQLESVFEALNALGNTKWRINKKVLHVVDQIWSSGGGLAELVDRNDVPLPEKPSEEDESELKKWKCNARSIRKENQENYAERCNIELKLSVARKMKDEDCFYFPHNVDFRGRAYPIHPHLNHLGSDICRGLLEFSDGRPLGKTGLNWLKIHLANLYAGGVEKLSHYDRRAFVEDHLGEIFDSADRPLDGERWWLDAEDPFQCLAVCMDLSKILRSPSHEMAISHSPVHQDGSCNGLQHYAALGRDKLGAISVNLIAGEKPSDVYSGIASRVSEIMKAHAEKDLTFNSDVLYARLLVNQVDRKLVKQTVMTSVYGVTYVGAQQQIRRRLKERCAISDDLKLFHASCYAAKVTLMALEEMFESARTIMSWLGNCAKIISSENQSVQWTTPLGLPVVQPYRKIGKRSVKTSLQILTLNQETEKILVHRQKTAFPPNFVHSLDGSHMMMTAVACKKAGINFAGVHDSYWTHACDVEVMSQILREKFVELHEKPILEQLLGKFKQSFPTLKFPPLPRRGDLELCEVMDSPYFFN